MPSETPEQRPPSLDGKLAYARPAPSSFVTVELKIGSANTPLALA